jgi:hypothetical protein
MVVILSILCKSCVKTAMLSMVPDLSNTLFSSANEYLVEQMYKRKPPGKRTRGRPKKSWLEGMVTAMKNRGLTFEDAQDR